jgi:hypothetical protein
MEREGRAALARLLRAGSRKDCGEACKAFARIACSDLADLFDPDSLGPFELVLKRRRGQRGPVPNFTLDRLLAYCVSDRLASDWPMEAAIADAMECFGVSRAKAFSAWEEHKSRLDTKSKIKPFI